MVRSRTGDRRISLISAMGLRREPQPPMPTVMPSRSSPTTSASDIRLSVMTRVPLLHERLAGLVAHTRQVELEGEALFVPVAALHVDRVDAVQRLLGGADDGAALGRDVASDLERGVAQLGSRHDLQHRPVVM